jgi:hypothetical protein
MKQDEFFYAWCTLFLFSKLYFDIHFHYGFGYFLHQFINFSLISIPFVGIPFVVSFVCVSLGIEFRTLHTLGNYLYHLKHSPTTFVCIFIVFWYRVYLTLPRLQTCYSPASTSHVTKRYKHEAPWLTAF